MFVSFEHNRLPCRTISSESENNGCSLVKLKRYSQVLEVSTFASVYTNEHILYDNKPLLQFGYSSYVQIISFMCCTPGYRTCI